MVRLRQWFKSRRAPVRATGGLSEEECIMHETQNPIDVDSYWEYGDPSGSEARFRAAAESAQGDTRLELLTQIARTFSLRGRCDEAHDLLNQVAAQLPAAGPRPQVRYLLERGRAFNSAGEPARAQALFVEAWEQAQAAGEDGLAVDAAHMVAITSAGTPESLAWARRGLSLARGSRDTKARALIPAMLNNSAWELHDAGRFEEALPVFEEARAEWIARGKPRQIQIAKWSLARCLRSLGRHDEALTIQRDLEGEQALAGTADGYVLEEIAENLAALGNAPAARAYFGSAADLLGRDEWFVKHEAARLAGLRSRAAGR
jgi:tetratricopeptide (TPR) repeat protein